MVSSSKWGVGSLTSCFFRIVAHEALPRSCCFTEAKYVKEPHFLQMELYLVQILFQEDIAQRAEVGPPATQHSDVGNGVHEIRKPVLRFSAELPESAQKLHLVNLGKELSVQTLQ